MDFQTPEQLYQHYQAVAHRLGNKHYVYPITPIAKGVSRPIRTITAKATIQSRAEANALPAAEEFWDKMVRENLPRSIQNAKRMAHCVAAKHHITPEDIFGKSRKLEIVGARKELYWWLVRKFGMSYPMVGQILNRDHTSVLSGVRDYEANLEKCPQR